MFNQEMIAKLVVATIPAIIGAIVAVLLWFLSARNLRKVDLLNKKREVRINFLIDAYRKIENSGNRSLEPNSEFTQHIESAIGDIQLFGTRNQAELAQKVSDTLADTGSVTYDYLLDELRKDLRSELKLEALPDTRKIMRVFDKDTMGRTNNFQTR